MNSRSSSVCVVSTAVALFVSACGSNGGDAEEARPVDRPRPGVSALSYWPKPMYKDRTVLKIRFTTTGPAPPRLGYEVELVSRGTDERCIRDHTPYPDRLMKGGRGTTYEVELYSDTFFDEARFCEGPAELRVWLAKWPPPRERARMVRRLTFRILPARPGMG